LPGVSKGLGHLRESARGQTREDTWE
jgi:hypothetical protein